MEPSVIDERHAIGIAHADVPRCALNESVGTVATRLRETPFTKCAVVNEDGVLLGSVDAGELQSDGTASIEDLMEQAPQTVRVDEEIPSLAKRMDEGSLDAVYVTDPEGHVLGLVTKADVQAASVHSGA